MWPLRGEETKIWGIIIIISLVPVWTTFGERDATAQQTAWEWLWMGDNCVGFYINMLGREDGKVVRW